jgi:hypothetical protein
MPRDVMQEAFNSAEVDKECTVRPDLRAGETLEGFQSVVHAADLLSGQGAIHLVEKHRESHTGNRFVDAIRFVRLR